MAAWRRKAELLLPELREQFAEDEPLTPNSAFFSILPFVREAHRRHDHDALRRVYAFAQWCHHQRTGSDLSNAVGVSFYEHLFDDWTIRVDVVPWLSPAVREAILPLWEQRLGPDRTLELRKIFGESRRENWRELRDVGASS